MIEEKRTDAGFWTIALGILVLVGFLPLLYPALPAGHDLLFHLARIQGLRDGFADGIFPVYINFKALDGFGYGGGLFYSDFFLCIPALLALCGFGTVEAYKLFLIFWGLASAFSMMYCLRKLKASDFGAFAGSLLYVWSSYLSVDIFTRAALGEITAFPFLPLVILGLYRLIYGQPGLIYPLVFGFAGLFLAHHVTFVLMGLFALIFCGLCLPRLLMEPRRIFWGLVAAGLFTGLVAFFLFPMLEQLLYMKYNLTETASQSLIHERSVPFTRLFPELPNSGLKFWMPPGIGIVFLVVAFQRFRTKSGWSSEERFRDGLLIAGFAALLFATDFMPWEGRIMKPAAAIQFPWHSYLPATALLAAAGGLLISELTESRGGSVRRWLWILLVGCGFAWFFNTGYAYAAGISEKNMVRRFVMEQARDNIAGQRHCLPAGISLKDIREFGAEAQCVPANSAKCEVLRSWSYRDLYFKFSENDPGEALRITLPLIPYKGYTAMLDDGSSSPIMLKTGHDGLLSFAIPAGLENGTVTVSYRGTLIQKISLLVSLALLGGLGLSGMIPPRRTSEPVRKKEKKRKKYK